MTDITINNEEGNMEVCVDTIESALNAEIGGAIRIELCSSLAEGGLTPSVGFLKAVKSNLGIPVFVMIRCRGGDFVYSDDEIQIMLEDIRLLKDNGADGFVLGVLNEHRDIDYNKCKVLVDACNPFPVTFHRAFDEVVNPKENFETIINLGCSRLLTSGCELTAAEGATLIRELVNEGKITVMPGSGITVENLGMILRRTGAKEFHGSAKVKVERNGHVRSVTDANLVVEMTDIYKKIVFCEKCCSCDCEHKCL